MSKYLVNKLVMANNIKRYMAEQSKTRNDICSALDIKYSTFLIVTNEGKQLGNDSLLELVKLYPKENE